MPRLPELPGRCAGGPLPAGCLRAPRRRLVRRVRAARRPPRHGDRRRGRPRLPRRRDHGPAPQRPARVRDGRDGAWRGARAAQPPAAPDRAGPHRDASCTSSWTRTAAPCASRPRATRRRSSRLQDGEPRFLELPGSVPLGATRHVRYEDHTLELDPGSVLVLYTDGLVERAGEPLDDEPGPADRHGARTARRTWSTWATRSSTCCCPRGPGPTTPLFCWRARMPLGEPLVARFPAEMESIPVMRRLLGRWLDEAGATRATWTTSRSRARRRRPTRSSTRTAWRPGSCELRAPTTGDDSVNVAIRDFGNWRPPRGTHRGRGLMLMEGLTDEVEVVPKRRGHHGRAVAAARRGGGMNEQPPSADVSYRDSRRRREPRAARSTSSRRTSCASAWSGAIRNEDLGLVVDLTRRHLHRQRRREPPVRARRAACGAPAAAGRRPAREAVWSRGCCGS